MLTGREGKVKDIDTIIVDKGKRGGFTPLQPDHYHRFFELFFLLSGKCSFFLRDTVYEMEKGDFIFIAPGELHHARYYHDSPCDIGMIYFKAEFIDTVLLKKWLPAASITEQRSFMGSIPPLYQEAAIGLLGRMLSERSRIDEYSPAFMSCYLQEVLLMLMRHSVMNEEEPDLLNARDADILLATKYICKNYQKPLSLQEVSSQAALSPTYFSKKFKQVTGMGFKEYLNFVRLKHAQTALLTTDNTITDIALENGFNDSNYFKDLFKKIYGKSPREYRKSPQ